MSASLMFGRHTTATGLKYVQFPLPCCLRACFLPHILRSFSFAAIQVKQMLASVPDIDAIMEAVPYLMNPAALAQSLANLRTWFPSSNPLQMLQENPTMLLNIEEADLDADPLYGELTTAG